MQRKVRLQDRPRQIKYLGFGFYKNNKGTWRPKPHIKSVKKFISKLKEITGRSDGKSIDYKNRKT